MRLYLSTEKGGDGWEGYQYVVNRVPPGEKARLERFENGWSTRQVAEIEYRVEGSVLQLAIPRQAVGLAGRCLDFGFKWQDNEQKDGDILDFYSSGETAPMGILLPTNG